MKKTPYRILAVFAMLGALAFAQVGCSTVSTTPATAAAQQAKYTDDVGQALILVDQVTLASTAAIKSDVLKSKDADNVIAGIKFAKDGLAVARQLVAAGLLTPGQGSARVAITIALLTASQAYLATLGKVPAAGAKA